MRFIGIDCGTQSLKLLAWDPEQDKTWSASEEYGLIRGLPPGHKEQDPQVWIQALEACFARFRREGFDFSRIEGVGVSGQQHGLVVLNGADGVIRPAKLWNDTSTQSQCDVILKRAGGPEAYQREIGNLLPPGFTASKLLWLKENEPDNYQEVRTFFLPHDYLNLHLTGEKTAEPGDASGTGYFRVAERQWSDRALQWIDPKRDLSAGLPRLIASHEPAGEVRLELQEKWGFSKGVTVSSGGGDNMMGAIGTGNVEPGVLTVSLGTSGTIYAYSDTPVIDPAGEIAAFCDSTGGWLPLGCTMNVTVATEMVRKELLGVDHAELERLAASIPAGSDGLLLLPYLEGERMPNVPVGTGVLLGLRPATSTPGHLARAAMEGVTFGLRFGMERLKTLGVSSDEIRLTGGGARSPLWRQIVADIFGLPAVCPADLEGPAFGAALQAFWRHSGEKMRHVSRGHLKMDESTRCVPDKGRAALYDRLFEVFQRLSVEMIQSDVFPAHRTFIQERT